MKIGTYVELVMNDYNAHDPHHPYRGIVVPTPIPSFQICRPTADKVAVRWLGYSDNVFHYPVARLKVLSTVSAS